LHVLSGMQPRTHLYLLLIAAICCIYLLNSFTTVPGNSQGHEKVRELSSRFGFNKIEIQRISQDELCVKYSLKSLQPGASVPKADKIEVTVLDDSGKMVGHSLGKRVLLDDTLLNTEKSYTIEITVKIGKEVVFYTEELLSSAETLSQK
jgi:hypothetical protein